MMQLSGFYAVIDRDDLALAEVLLEHSDVIQLRMKHADARSIIEAAGKLRGLCDRRGARLVINDRLDIALAVRADAVHLGQTDLPIAEARAIAGERLLIGVSTHDLAQVRAAVGAGADYLGYGPVFATSTKANPDPVQGLDALRATVQAAGTIPVVAIGGITPAHARDIYATGASAICAIGAVLNAADVGNAAKALSVAKH